MNKDINIDSTFVKVPMRIIIDGKKYPITQWNIEVVQKFWDTGDEAVLDELKDFSFSI